MPLQFSSRWTERPRRPEAATGIGCGGPLGPSWPRSCRGRRARLPVATAIVWAVLTLACSKGEEPLGARPGSGDEAALAGKPSDCDAAASPIPSLIDAQFPGGNRNAVRARCANILRKAATDQAIALRMAIELAGFILKHSKGTVEQQIELISAFLCASQGQAPGGGCTFQIPPGAEINIVGPGGGGPFIVDDGKIGYLLEPGWSVTPRIVFTVPGDCALDTPFSQFPECALHGTIPAGQFATPQSGILAHCATVPDAVDLDNLRLARNIDSFNDPGATDAGGSEFYPNFAPPFVLPGCVVEESAARVVRPEMSGATGPLTDSKHGSSGISLAATKTQGGQISSFSEWGIVDITSSAASIEGRIVADGIESVEPIEGASVDLFCDEGIGDETPAGPTIVTGSDGTFSFSAVDYDFAAGSTCLVTASAEGFFSGSSGDFSVVAGTNALEDIVLDPLSNSPPSATIDSPEGSSVPLDCETSALSFAGTASDDDGTVVSFAWTFEGGVPATGSVEDPGSVSWASASDGEYTVTFDVTDDDGASDPTPATLTVSKSCF